MLKDDTREQPETAVWGPWEVLRPASARSGRSECLQTHARDLLPCTFWVLGQSQLGVSQNKLHHVKAGDVLFHVDPQTDFIGPTQQELQQKAQRLPTLLKTQLRQIEILLPFVASRAFGEEGLRTFLH